MELNNFNNKLDEYNTGVTGRMYILEITKFCGYSTFIYMYKDETLTDLYNRVAYHFCCKNIKGLYINNNLHKKQKDISDAEKNLSNQTCCCFDKKDYICVPISSLTTIKEFVFENTAREPRNLVPIYSLPSPVVYRIYLDDGHCHIC